MVHAGEMSALGDTDERLQQLDRQYRAKARAEVEAAEKLAKGAGVVRGQGDLLADVLLVIGKHQDIEQLKRVK